MVWNLIVPVVGRYATALTLPIAMVIGGLGYYIEKRCRGGVPYTPVPHEKTIIDERAERQNQEEPTASLYRMETILPKTIFERNDPAALRKTH